MPPFIVFDIETTVDTEAVARAYDLRKDDPNAIKAVLGDAFPKTAFHKVVAIAAATLTYHPTADRHWSVLEMATLHAEGGDDAGLVKAFVDYCNVMHPVLVSFNGTGFDLPVIRSRAMLHRLKAPRLAHHAFKRYKADHIDLCEVLTGPGRDRMTLDQAARYLRVGTKTPGMNGGSVDALADAGEFHKVAAYCLDDVTITAGLFLLYQMWQGALDPDQIEEALAGLRRARDLTLVERPQGFIREALTPLVPML